MIIIQQFKQTQTLIKQVVHGSGATSTKSSARVLIVIK